MSGVSTHTNSLNEEEESGVEVVSVFQIESSFSGNSIDEYLNNDYQDFATKDEEYLSDEELINFLAMIAKDSDCAKLANNKPFLRPKKKELVKPPKVPFLS